MPTVQWFGPLFHAGGYGNVTRNFLLGLRQLDVPVQAVNIGPDDRHLLDAPTLREIEALTSGRRDEPSTAVIHWEPPGYHRFHVRHAVCRIGCTIFETDRIPLSWVQACNRMDEIWVPSQFNIETFSRAGVSFEKLRLVPYGVNTNFFQSSEDMFPLPDRRRFVFLYVAFFDWRKGFDLLLEAYSREFNDRDDTTLVLKVSEDYHLQEQLTALRGMVADVQARAHAPHVMLLAGRLQREQLRQLYNSCNLYISTDRANGWGMPCMEAMAMGKPAATINWSGSTQFMSAAHSLLIHPTGRLVPVDERLVAHRPLYAGHCWAEVTVEEVQRVMRQAYAHPRELAALAQRGQAYVRAEHSLAAAAARLRDRISAWHAAPRRPRGWRRLLSPSKQPPASRQNACAS